VLCPFHNGSLPLARSLSDQLCNVEQLLRAGSNYPLRRTGRWCFYFHGGGRNHDTGYQAGPNSNGNDSTDAGDSFGLEKLPPQERFLNTSTSRCKHEPKISGRTWGPPSRARPTPCKLKPSTAPTPEWRVLFSSKSEAAPS
jgi:hypothetical protein